MSLNFELPDFDVLHAFGATDWAIRLLHMMKSSSSQVTTLNQGHNGVAAPQTVLVPA
jgi:hypothetical protein